MDKESKFLGSLAQATMMSALAATAAREWAARAETALTPQERTVALAMSAYWEKEAAYYKQILVAGGAGYVLGLLFSKGAD